MELSFRIAVTNKERELMQKCTGMTSEMKSSSIMKPCSGINNPTDKSGDVEVFGAG